MVMGGVTNLSVGASADGTGPVKQAELFASAVVDLARIGSLLVMRTEDFDIFQRLAQLRQDAAHIRHVTYRRLKTRSFIRT